MYSLSSGSVIAFRVHCDEEHLQLLALIAHEALNLGQGGHGGGGYTSGHCVKPKNTTTALPRKSAMVLT